MPIPFTCPHCGQLMRVGQRKVGQAIQCVRCHGGVIVPSPVADPTPTTPPLPPEPVESPSQSLPRRHLGWDSAVLVPRGALYSMGGLIVVVAVVSFLLGWAMGRDSSVQHVISQTSTYQRVGGRLTYVASRGRSYSDSEAVVVAVPAGRKPDEKFEIDALRPDVPPTNLQHPTMQAIRSLGGDVARAGPNGDFELQLPTSATYFVLMISNHQPRPRERPPTTTEIVEIGHYFQRAAELLGGNDYRWSKHVIRADMTLDHEFGGR